MASIREAAELAGRGVLGATAIAGTVDVAHAALQVFQQPSRGVVRTVDASSFLNKSLNGFRLSFSPRTAEAADGSCVIRRLKVYGFGFIDHPTEKNTVGIIDEDVDLRVGVYDFQPAVVTVHKSPYDRYSEVTEEYTIKMDAAGDHSEGELRDLWVTPNTNNGTAVVVHFWNSADKVKTPEDSKLPVVKRGVIRCGKDGVGWIGRYAERNDISSTASGTQGVDSIGFRMDQLMAQAFGADRTLKLTPPGHNPGVNLQTLKTHLQAVLERERLVRDKEKKSAAPTPPSGKGSFQGETDQGNRQITTQVEPTPQEAVPAPLVPAQVSTEVEPASTSKDWGKVALLGVDIPLDPKSLVAAVLGGTFLAGAAFGRFRRN